jgi:hypothetical protein
MANKKITELSANTSPSFSDVLPIVNSGTTKKLSLSGLTDFLSTTELKFPDAPIDGNQYARENGDWAIIQSQLNEITYSAGFTIDTNQVTMLSGWTWTINGIGYTNLVDVIINIPAASDGFRRIDLIVADVLDTFYLVQGIESNDIPVAPNLPADTLQATFITVNGSTVEITPVEGNFVTLDTAQTIVGAKLFTQDIFINNMRVGIGMGNLDTNVVFGAGSFSANTSGTFNVGIGQNSLQKNITGNNNTAIGAFTLANPTASSFNVAIGTAALQNTTTGDQNIGIGASSLRNTTTGLRNIGIGASSLLNNIIGISNTGIGNQALLRSTGDYNVAIGRNAGAAIVSGNKNIIITNDATSSTLGLTNGSNNIYLGSTNTGILTGSSNVIIGTVSGLSTTLSNNVIIADGSGNQKIKINENGIVNIPTVPTLNTSGTNLLIRNSSTGDIERLPVSAITSGITTPNLQEVTDVSNETSKGIFINNPLGQYFLGTEYMGGTPRFLVTASGDDTVFPGQYSVLIQADLNEWITLSSTDGTSSTTISNTPTQARISKNISSTAYTLNVDENGIGIETNGNLGYLKTDNLAFPRTYQLPDNHGTIALLSDVSGATPFSGITVIPEGNFIIADDFGNNVFIITEDGEIVFNQLEAGTLYKIKTDLNLQNKIQNLKVSILGDSISTSNGGGVGIPEPDTYGGLLRDNENCLIYRDADAGSNLSTDFTNDARVNSLNSIFEPDVILVFGGINDFLEDATLGTFGDTTTATFYGGVDVLCKKLQTRYPNARIFFMTPIHTMYTLASIPENNGTNYLTEFVEAIEKVCKRYGISVINTNQDSGITCYNIGTLASDLIHVGVDGHIMIYNTVVSETNLKL